MWLWNFPEDNQKMIDYRWRGIPLQIIWIFYIVYGQDSGPLSTEVGRTGKSDSLIAKYPKVMNITWIYWQAGKKPYESKKSVQFSNTCQTFLSLHSFEVLLWSALFCFNLYHIQAKQCITEAV